MESLVLLYKVVRKYRGTIICVTAIALLYVSRLEIRTLQAQLASKPATEVKTVTKVVEGPTKVVERIVRLPGKQEVVEKIVYKEGAVTTTGTESATRPALPELFAPSPPWIRPAAGASYSLSNGELDRVSAGVSLWNRVSVMYGMGVGPRRRGSLHAISLSVAF